MSKVKTALASIGIYLVFGFIISLLLFYYISDLGKINAIRSGVTVTAEIKNLYPHIREGGHPTTYDLRYEYISPDGIQYTEVVFLGTTDKEEALSHIGEKIEIYIDGKGNSVPVGHDVDVNTRLIVAIVFGLLAVGYTIGLIIYCVKEHKWDIEHKKKLAEKAALEAQQVQEGSDVQQ